MIKKFIYASAMIFAFAACSDDEVTLKPDVKPEERPEVKPEGKPEEPKIEALFNVVLSTSTTGNTETYVQALDINELSEGEISFNNYGFEVPSTRTARVYASTDGKNLYNLNYGGGTILKFDAEGGQKYTQTHETNVAPTVGTEYPRWTKLNDEKALIHNVKNNKIFKDAANESGYLYTEAKATLVDVNLSDLSLGNSTTFEIPLSDTDKKENHYISRIDAPVISGGKAYYGVTKSKVNPAKPDEKIKDIKYPATSLVVDYPSLTNPKVVESSVALGSTYGYRIPVAHEDEKGDAYQLCKTHMLKLSNGNYDDSYNFDISKAMGFSVETQGWFYAGNGIGYALYYDAVKGNSEKAAAWGIVRLDIYNKTAIKMNTPAGLYLFQHQHAKVINGKVYMALCPVGGEGNIYIFDSTKADANGFELGAKLKTGAGASYIGIF